MAAQNKRSSVVLNRISIIGLTLLVGVGIGVVAVVAFINFRIPNAQTTAESTPTKERWYSTKNSDTDPTNSIEVGQFEEIFKHNSISKQYTALHATLSQATEQELKSWWNQSKEIKRASHRKIAQRAILQNLSTINPREALQKIEEVSRFEVDVLLKSVFSQWSVSGLDNAIEAATTFSAPRRRVALQAILETRDDLTDSKRRSIATQLSGEEIFLKLTSDTLAAHSISEPEQSWSILLSDDVDDALQMETLEIVATAMYEQVGFEVLSKIYAEIDDYGSKVHLLKEIARTEPARALEYSYGLNADYDKLNLSTIIVRDWAKADPQTALAAVSSLKPSSFSSRLEDTVVTTWARTTPNTVIENVEAIPEQFRLSTLETALATIARQDPMDALATLGSVESFVGNTSSILKKIVTEWSYQQPDAAADWVDKNYTQDDSQRRALFTQILPRLALQNPEKAFELAITQTTTHEGVGLDHLVIRELALAGNIDEAKKLLPRVQESSRAAVYGTIGEFMIRESEALDSLELGRDLNENHQSFYYVRVLSLWAATKPKNLYESLDDLPTSDLESKAALHLILANRRQPVLSDDQIEHAKILLNSDDELHLNRIVKPD